MAISVVLGRRDLNEVDMVLLLKKSPAAAQARGGLEDIDCDRFVEILGEVDSDVIVAKSCVKEWLKQMYLLDILAETFVSQVTTLSFLYQKARAKAVVPLYLLAMLAETFVSQVE